MFVRLMGMIQQRERDRELERDDDDDDVRERSDSVGVKLRKTQEGMGFTPHGGIYQKGQVHPLDSREDCMWQEEELMQVGWIW